jgi:hypothetical protein
MNWRVRTRVALLGFLVGVSVRTAFAGPPADYCGCNEKCTTAGQPYPYCTSSSGSVCELWFDPWSCITTDDPLGLCEKRGWCS